MKALFTFFILLLITKQPFAQNKNYVFTHIDTRNGLAGEEVTGFAQDSKGFIWITTDNGLQRFDGESFVTYRHDSKESNSLYGDENFLPLFDKENNLWLNDANSIINIFNTHTGKAIKISLGRVTEEKGDDRFVTYCKDGRGILWLCSSRALYRYSNIKKIAEKIAVFPDSLIARNIWSMTCDTTTGDLWIGTEFCLIQYNKRQNVFFDFHYNPEHAQIFNVHSEPYCIYIDCRRNLWFSTWQGELFRYNLPSHFLKQYHFKTTLTLNPNSMVGGIVEDKTGNIWIGANSSDIFYYNPGKDSLQLASKHFIEKPTSNQQNIECMFCDRENNIWIATDFGAYYFNPAKQKIYAVSNDLFDIFSLPASQVETFGQSKDGLIWASSRDGGRLSVFDKQMILIKHSLSNTNGVSKKIFGLSVSAFCNGRDGKLWMAAYNTLMRYDPVSKKIDTWFAPALNFFVLSMICDQDGNIWIGGGNAIVEMDPISGLKKTFTNFSPGYISKPAEILDLLIDAHNDIWIATSGDGLFHFDKQRGTFDESFTHNENDIHSLCNNQCISLSMYNDSSILIGTANGLSVFNTNNKQFNSLYNTDGMLSNAIHGISADKHGNIFTSTINGLYEIDHATHGYTHYTNEDGILDNQFYTKIFKTDNGLMLMGGLNSFIYFDPDDLKETFTPPNVQITGYKVFNQQYSNDSVSAINLSYDKNFITFEYASLYYHSPAKIHYYYKLNGVDKDWVDAGNKRNAVYTGLNNGNYIFEVKCVNNNGIACAQITKMEINISPPYYKTWWFILLCAFIVISVGYLIYDFRRSNQKYLANVRTHIASDLHDDIGSTLNSISVYSEVAGQQMQTNSEQAKTILEKMGYASRSMIDRMNDIVWAINPKNDEFENILQRMQYFAAELLSAKNILFHFDVDEHIQRIKLPMEKRKNFYLIYKEAINNAYKYAEGKNVNVSIAEKDNSLIMIITDNGKGFDMASKSVNGNGLGNMKTRAEEIHAKLDITSWPGKGTRVYLQMKV